MYSTRSGVVLGFHGCDKVVADAVLSGSTILKSSTNSYDWLGYGIYFWENSPSRALEFVEHLHKHPNKSKTPIRTPAVIGAVIDLSFCLDLLDYQNLQMLKDTYQTLLQSDPNSELPRNRSMGNTSDLLLRDLDCAVIESVHMGRRKNLQQSFDSVRSVFYEGGELYPNAGFREKDHVQICIRNPNCIKGFFVPREMDYDYPKV
jgi:hypothetical protein